MMPLNFGDGLSASEWARSVVALPQEQALETLRVFHNETCTCGSDGGPEGPVDGPAMLLSWIQEKWGNVR